jgi:hypothetical protein
VPDPPISAVAAIGGAALAFAFFSMAYGRTADRYLVHPTAAGTVAKSADVPPDQQMAWSIGFQSDRLLAYYWDLAPRIVTESLVRNQQIPDDNVIFVNLSTVPDWYPAEGPSALKQDRRYALIRAGDLRAALDGAST